MATYSSHRLIMGKVEICNFFLSQWRYLEFFFTEMFIEKSSMFCITYVQIGVFDWLSGRQKRVNFRKKRLKIFFSETIWRMKPKLGILA